MSVTSGWKRAGRSGPCWCAACRLSTLTKQGGNGKGVDGRPQCRTAAVGGGDLLQQEGVKVALRNRAGDDGEIARREGRVDGGSGRAGRAQAPPPGRGLAPAPRPPGISHPSRQAPRLRRHHRHHAAIPASSRDKQGDDTGVAVR